MPSRPSVPAKASRFQDGGMRGMSRVSSAPGGVNLARGFPDLPAPEAMKGYAMTGAMGPTELDEASFAMERVPVGGLATVPGSSFFQDPAGGRGLGRFCFAMRLEILERAAQVPRERLGGAA